MSEVPVPPRDLSAQAHARSDEEPRSATLEGPAPGGAWDDEALPGRPRRRFLTPLTAVLLAALVGVAGFIGGVQVEKGQLNAPSSAGGRTARLGLGAAGGGGGGGRAAFTAGSSGAGNATIGQVANVSGADLFVTDLQGTTIRINASAAQVTKQVATNATGIHPGDTVVAQGAKAPDGSVQATTIRDAGAGTGGAGGGLFGGGGGRGGGGPAGAGSAGTGAAGGAAAGGGQALFGPSSGR